MRALNSLTIIGTRRIKRPIHSRSTGRRRRDAEISHQSASLAAESYQASSGAGSSFKRDFKPLFTDIPVTFWSYAAIFWAYDNNYMKDVTKTKFSPNSTIHQAIIVQVLARVGQS